MFLCTEASDRPGTVTVTVQSKNVIFLGDISFEYIDDEETSLSRLVKDPRFLKKFFTKMAEEQDKKTCECEKQFNLQPPYNDTTAGMLLYCTLLKWEEHYYFHCPCGA